MNFKRTEATLVQMLDLCDDRTAREEAEAEAAARESARLRTEQEKVGRIFAFVTCTYRLILVV